MSKITNLMGKFEKGVTLLEALIVLGLMAAMLLIVVPAFYEIIQKYRAETAVEQIVMNLRFARLAAVKKRIQYKVVIRDELSTPANTYEVQMDPLKIASFEKYTRADTSLPAGLTILSGGISQILYNPRGVATITGGGNIRVKSTDYSYRINVFTSGAVTKTRE